MARVPYVDPEDLPADKRQVIIAQRTPDDMKPEYRHLMGDQRTRNFYRALGNLPDIAAGFRAVQKACWEAGALTDYQRECIILTVARHTDSEYEWHQHVRIALNEGHTPEEIRAISRGEYDIFEPAEQTLIRYTLAVIENEVDDAIHEEMLEHFDTDTIINASMLAGTYHMNALVGEALDIDREEADPWAGWNLEHIDLPEE